LSKNTKFKIQNTKIQNKMKDMTWRQVQNKAYRQKYLEHNKNVNKCFGWHYVSGNRARSSGYEQCKLKDTCPYYTEEVSGRDGGVVSFGSVVDFRKCNYNQ
jgi:hypothetical protein